MAAFLGYHAHGERSEAMVISDYQVLQRDADGKARVRLHDGAALELPVGGPYDVGTARQVLVGDLWVLAGQSNMEGVGDLVDVEATSPFVHSFQSCERWAVAAEPLHWLSESPRAVHHALLGRDPIPSSPEQRDPGRAKGVGPGLAFAKEYYARTGVPVGLIPSAHGGTSLEQWDPGLRARGGDSLYGATMERIAAVGGRIAGILWYQGESDASPEGAGRFHDRALALTEAFRRDQRRPDLPFYFVQIGCVFGDSSQGWGWSPDGWNAVREAQRRLAGILPHSGMVTAIGLELDDLIHIGTRGQTRLGRRLARVATGLSAPDVIGARVEGPRVCVAFSGIRGGLRATGRPSGFSLRDATGRALALIYKTTLDGSTAVLHLAFDAQYNEARLREGTYLWYGWGCGPYCNITDEADMAIPAFGPLPLA
jgi:sialate O-acetylesterase